MEIDSPILRQRMDYAKTRTEDLKDEVGRNPDLADTDICVYVTGSYGRLEAHDSSDLDLFFVRKGSFEKNSLSIVEKAIFDCALIKTARQLGFPEFTKGGVYLEVHYLDDILSILGSPRDDYDNFFTARMLLLLESVPILNDSVYYNIIKEIISSYYRDYHDHEVNFQPAFLVNDIHRYWITMCLNYEHARNRKNLSGNEKNKAHLKNVKLKFSRLLTCYSMIAPILSFPQAIPPDEVIKLAHKTPIGRLISMSQQNTSLEPLVNEVLDYYGWFLEQIGKPEEDALRWIGIRKNRDEAFKKARDFGKCIFRLVIETSDQERLRYLIV